MQNKIAKKEEKRLLKQILALVTNEKSKIIVRNELSCLVYRVDSLIDSIA